MPPSRKKALILGHPVVTIFKIKIILDPKMLTIFQQFHLMLKQCEARLVNLLF